LVAAVFGIQRAVGEYRLRTVRRELLARGEALSVEPLAPKPPGASENACEPLVALQAGLLERKWVLSHHPRSFLTPNGTGISLRDLDHWDSPVGGDDRVTWTEFGRRAGLLARELEPLDETLRRPRLLGSQTRYDAPFPAMPHLYALKSLGLCLGSLAVVDIREARAPRAVRRIETALRISRLLREEPLVTSQETCLGIQDAMVAVTWQLLTAEGLHDEDLAGLAAALDTLTPDGSMARAVSMERALFEFEFARCRRSLDAAASYFPLENESSGGNLLEFRALLRQSLPQPGPRVYGWLWQRIWSPGDAAACLGVMQRAVEVHRGLASGRTWGDLREDREAVNRFVDEIGGPRSIQTPLSHMRVGLLSGLDSRTWRAEARRRLAIAALGVRRRLLHDATLPARLDDLVPRWLPSVPRDPYDGMPLRFRPGTNGTFVLYAVGEDLRDDGGTVMDVTRSEMLETIWAALARSPDVVWPAIAPNASARSTLEEFEKRTRLR
jgi:hypothetical protein